MQTKQVAEKLKFFKEIAIKQTEWSTKTNITKISKAEFSQHLPVISTERASKIISVMFMN